MKELLISKSRTIHKVIARNLPVFLTDAILRTPGLMMCMVAMLTIIPWYFYEFVYPYHIPFGAWAKFGIILSCAIATVWLMLTPYNLIKRWRKWPAVIWLLLCFIILISNWLIDFALLYVYQVHFNSDLAAVLLATNLSESSDFIKAYLDAHVIWAFAGYIMAFSATFFIGSYIRKLYIKYIGKGVKTLRIVSLLIIIIVWCVSIFIPDTILTQTTLYGKCDTFIKLDLGQTLIPVHPELIVDTSAGPQKIVIILGESHTRSHSSIYGYEKPTQPLQDKLVADSLLYVFRHPTAPELTTLCVLHRILGTWNGGASPKWYESLSFIEVANIVGYHTLWLSNQSSKGVVDNPIVKIAEFCDTYEFTNNGMKGMANNTPDEEVLHLIDKHHNSSQKDLTLIHLMGSHADYSARYPRSFEKFKESDYTNQPVHQRKDLAHYDNSILYNDYIISEIITRYADDDAIIIYLSDHAEDLYESSSEYKGHGKKANAKSKIAGTSIPFTIYLTEKFKKLHPQMAARIAASTTRHVNTTNLIYALMDIMGARFRDNDDVKKYTFF